MEVRSREAAGCSPHTPLPGCSCAASGCGLRLSRRGAAVCHAARACQATLPISSRDD